MCSFIDLAKQYSKAGYSVIPVTSEKIPAIRDWSQFQTRPMTDKECEINFSNCWGIALLMGGVWHGICYIVITNILKFNYNEKRIITN